MITPETLYLSVQQVADRFGVSTDSVWRWMRTGDFPRAVKQSSGTTRWRLAYIEAWEGSRQFSFAGHFLLHWKVARAS
jgi:predicted DNA-binding transcriptional regulator AlpA